MDGEESDHERSPEREAGKNTRHLHRQQWIRQLLENCRDRQFSAPTHSWQLLSGIVVIDKSGYCLKPLRLSILAQRRSLEATSPAANQFGYAFCSKRWFPVEASPGIQEVLVERKDIWSSLLFCGVLMTLLPWLAVAHQVSQASSSSKPAERDGQHDFDWDIGTWKTHQKRLLNPLSGSTTWVEYDGTDVVRRIWDGANQAIIEADGPAGHLEIFTLRIYDPQAHQWNIYFTSRGGTLSQPVIGEFKNGRGEFYDQEPYKGRAIMVRFSVSDMTPVSCHFEQAFSADGGKTWETNFIVTEALVKGEAHKTE